MRINLTTEEQEALTNLIEMVAPDSPELISILTKINSQNSKFYHQLVNDYVQKGYSVLKSCQLVKLDFPHLPASEGKIRKAYYKVATST